MQSLLRGQPNGEQDQCHGVSLFAASLPGNAGQTAVLIATLVIILDTVKSTLRLIRACVLYQGGGHACCNLQHTRI